MRTITVSYPKVRAKNTSLIDNAYFERRPHRVLWSLPAAPNQGRVRGVILDHVVPHSQIETAPGGMTAVFEARLWGQECAAETAAERA